MTPDEEIKRAEYASRLLMEPLFQEVMEQMEQDTIVAWRQSKDPLFRDDCWKMLWVIEVFKGSLKTIVDNGMIAQNKLEKVTNG